MVPEARRVGNVPTHRIWIRAEEKRRRDRRRAKDLRITPPIDGKVLNLSSLGVAIEASEALTIGESYWFLLRWGGYHFRIDGTVKWCALVKTKRQRAGTVSPVYRAGVALEVPGPEALRFLKSC